MLDFLTENIDISKEQAFNIAALLGSGLNKGSICGAVTSGYLFLGLKYGNNKELVKNKMREFDEEFLKINHNLTCEELLGGNVTIPKEKEKIIADGTKKVVCPKAIQTSIEILKKL